MSDKLDFRYLLKKLRDNNVINDKEYEDNMDLMDSLEVMDELTEN